MEKTRDAVIPADLKRLFLSGTYMSRWSRKGYVFSGTTLKYWDLRSSGMLRRSDDFWAGRSDSFGLWLRIPWITLPMIHDYSVNCGPWGTHHFTSSRCVTFFSKFRDCYTDWNMCTCHYHLLLSHCVFMADFRLLNIDLCWVVLHIAVSKIRVIARNLKMEFFIFHFLFSVA